MAPQNARQIADWNGPSGERWIVNQARLDAMLAVFGKAAIEAAAPVVGERVLDVGCGAGTSSFALATLVGAGGRVLGVDVSAPLIARARALAPPDATAQFQVADASSAELPDGAFDLLFSRFGVMFFDDPTGAFARLRRALRPGGRVAFVCWRSAAENGWARLPMEAIEGLVPSAVPPVAEAPGPFSFGDQGRVARILTTAGFAEIALAPLDASIPFGQGETRDAAIDDGVQLAIDAGPLARVLAEQPNDVRARATAAVRTAFAALPVGRSVMTDGAAWVVTARNPLHPSQGDHPHG
ncbi:class I SAM-dependent methyltransferase [Xylophilus sp. GW821-FHT01B05]